MIAGVLLLVVLVLPDRSLVSATFQMPSVLECHKARLRYLSGPVDAHEIPETDALQFRSALCVTVPMPGRDA